MPLLISFCNQVSTPSLNLLLVDESNVFNSRWVEYPSTAEDEYYGCTGVERIGNKYYVLTQGHEKHTDLLVFDAMFTFLNKCRLSWVKNGHSMAQFESSLYIVSTEDNAVYRVQLSDDGTAVREETRFWHYPGLDYSVHDDVHLNSISVAHGSLLVTCFGERAGDTWRGARSGRCLNISTGEVVSESLAHPHTVKFLDDRLLVCNSAAAGLLISTRGSREGLDQFVELQGYVRGLDYHGERFFVGSSAARRVSRSAGTVNVHAGQPGTCGVHMLNRELEVEGFVDLSWFGSEVYDVVYFDGIVVPGDAVGRRIEAYEESLVRCRFSEVEKVERQLLSLQRQNEALKRSRAFRIGRLITLPVRALVRRGSPRTPVDGH